MANTRTLQRSFSGGELSPEMFGQLADAKFQSGLAKCLNFVIKPQGPAENRAGFAYVREVKDSSKAVRLIPFTYSTTQTMVIEIGEGYFRFHTAGATLVLAATAWVTATAYTIGSLVTYSGTTYYCKESHTSGTWATDLAAAKWRVFAWETSTAYVVGDLVSQSGTTYYCTTAHTSGTFSTDLAAGKWYAEPATGEYEIPNPYAEADLFSINYVQSADVLTLVHTGYAPRELRRYGATDWILSIISFAASIAAPTSVTAAQNGEETDYSYSYVVTAVSADLVSESVASSVATVSGNLYITGNTITIAFTGSTGAKYYNVYKLQCGTYGYIGQTTKKVDETIDLWEISTLYHVGDVVRLPEGIPSGIPGGTYYCLQEHTSTGWEFVAPGYWLKVDVEGSNTYSLVDDNIAPDLSKTPPIYDEVFNEASEYPAAVSYYEQRRCFAGTINNPQNFWMTRSGTESNMSYSLPIRADDRIAIRVAAREANTIRHIVPLSELLLLTSAAEWRVTSVNSDIITGDSISVKPQSYIGSGIVQPVIVNTNMIYAAARGGHARECSYNWQANGFITGDLSLRTAHLFDGYEIVDLAFSKAPIPVVWLVSSSGLLLGLTYIPEQQIGAWHQHDTLHGVFESCTAVAEDTEDVLYVVVKRLINGSYVRYIERMASRAFVNQEDAFFVDSGLTYDGTNTGVVTMTLTGGITWGSSETLTLTASSATFTYPGAGDVGDAIVLTDAAGIKYTFTIAGVSSTTVVTGRVDKTITTTSGLRSTATTSWAFAHNSFSGLSHLEGETVNILADGAVHAPQVVASGAITLDVPAVVLQVGLPITADLQTLPAVMQVDAALGQGRYKNINQAWLRVFKSSGIWIGPDEEHLVEAKQRTTELYGSPPDLKTAVIPVLTTPSWTESGQVYIRQSDPLPLCVVSLTLEIAIGG